MELIADQGHIFIILACVFGLFMAWGIGANDVSNAMGTSIGSKALTVKQALLIAVVFEFAGAFLAGGEVTETIRKGLFDPQGLEGHADLLVLGMLGSLLASGTWLLIASYKGWPVSTTHSLVGAIIGFAAVGISMDAVNWTAVGNVAASWVVSPVVAGFISYFLFQSIKKLILEKADPIKQAQIVVPWYIMLVGLVISLVTLLKGLTHLGLNLSFGEATLYSFGISLVIMAFGFILVKRVINSADSALSGIEKVFGLLMVFTACAMAFAHGSNDVANAIGPVAAIYGVVTSGGEIQANTHMPIWILLIGALGIVVGLVTFGHRVIATIGSGITALTPSRGFAATLATAITVVVASATGLPVSSTQILVGAILGVGLAVGGESLNYRKVGSIFASWLVTLPAGAALSITFFFIFRAIWG
ncbi:MAG: inorganic phosphate transporter [Venatoribacter sp.]